MLNVLDIENDFSNLEIDSLTHLARSLQRKKKIRILIVSIDDLYPYNSIKEYAEKQGNEWGIGAKSDKGGIIFIFSKTLRKMRISTTNVAQQYLTNQESQEIINNILLPNFKKEKYCKGILEMIMEIEKKI